MFKNNLIKRLLPSISMQLLIHVFFSRAESGNMPVSPEMLTQLIEHNEESLEEVNQCHNYGINRASSTDCVFKNHVNDFFFQN